MKEQIAFLFLTRGEVNNYFLWEQYFHNIDPELYQIFIHPKEPNTLKSSLWTQPNSNILRPIPTAWGTISLVKATLYLIQMALKKPNIKKCVLVSEFCIPTTSFLNFYNFLTTIPNKSILQWNFGKNIDRLKLISKFCPIPTNQWAKQSQWMCLDRKHMEFLFLPNNKSLQYLNMFQYCPAADEHYFINYFIHFIRLEHREIINHPSTFVEWPSNTQHPKLFSDIDKKLLDYCKTNKIFFARKFTPILIPQDTLEYLLDIKISTIQSEIIEKEDKLHQQSEIIEKEDKLHQIYVIEPRDADKLDYEKILDFLKNTHSSDISSEKIQTIYSILFGSAENIKTISETNEKMVANCIDEVNEENHKLDEESHNVYEETHKLDEENHKLDEESHKLGEESHKLDEESHNVYEESHKVNEESHNVYEETHKLDEENHKLDEENHKLDEENHKSDEESHKLDEENHNVYEENHKLDEENHKLDEENHKLDEESHEVNEETHKLDEESHKLDEENHNVYEENHKLDEENHNVYEENHKLDEETHKLDEENHKLDEENHKLDEESHKLDEENHNVYEENHNVYEESHKVYEENHKLDEENHKLDEENHNVYEENHKLDEENHNVYEENHKLDEEPHKLDEESHKLDEENHKLDEESHKVYEENHKLDEETHKLDEETHKLDSDKAIG